MSQMLFNPAKASYIKFDAIAKTMKRLPSTSKEKSTTVKGLLKRLKQMPRDEEKEDKKQEPLEIALDYFVAIRQQRDKIKAGK